MVLCQAIDILSEDWASLDCGRSFSKASVPDFFTNNQQVLEFSNVLLIRTTTYCLEINSYSSEPSIGVKAVEGSPHVVVPNNGAL